MTRGRGLFYSISKSCDSKWIKLKSGQAHDNYDHVSSRSTKRPNQTDRPRSNVRPKKLFHSISPDQSKFPVFIGWITCSACRCLAFNELDSFAICLIDSLIHVDNPNPWILICRTFKMSHHVKYFCDSLLKFGISVE